MAKPDVYQLYYWPEIPGRGEFVRLVLEEAGAAYVDVGRLPGEQGGGSEAVAAFYEGRNEGHPIFAPPVLKHGDFVLAQTAAICHFLGRRHGLAPGDEAGDAQALALELTVADLVAEVHDTHHPISSALYYEDQRPEAKRRTAEFWRHRLPKFLGYFENVLERSGGPYLLGRKLSYVDLSLFQIVTGLYYAFPKRMKRFERKVPLLIALRDRVAARPRIKAYLQSDRRIAFNEWGIFRRYPELDS